ncbi:acyl-CoA thioesterase domain-containing protein [Rhodococcus sp. DMU1]|uniref:acyl-CoA thioesterase n=1 Tax=Rhodococcus sp. DMU1 TaxID=2722825 RepID=UPI00143E83F7|nr:acyl-CoA thioesterase domain-containing protein [Rhodococcus sp. DMU1]QIX53769.1 acyl-CoA thioesterase II [Rhodococcus sp. DMU1]
MPVTPCDLLELIALDQVGPTVFEGIPTRYRLPRVFGGQVAGMALEAAARTLTAPWSVHSVQSQFLRPGDADRPIRFVVEKSRDGGSFASRNVDAYQGETRLFSARMSFHRTESGGFEHQLQQPAFTPPDGLPAAADLARERPDEWPQFYLEWDQLDIRVVPTDPASPPMSSTGAGAHSQVWMRTVRPLDTGAQNVHSALLTCIADLTFLSTSLVPHHIPPSHPGIMMASLDHCLWFHRPFRVDEWLLYDQVSPTAYAGRGLCRGEFYTADGVHVASVIQEGLIRPLT